MAVRQIEGANVTRGNLRAMLLISACVIPRLSTGSAAETQPAKAPLKHLAVLLVKRPHVTGTALKSFSALGGIERVTHNPKARMLVFSLTPDGDYSPRDIWDVAERLDLKPVRLVTAKQIFTARPPDDEQPRPRKAAAPSRHGEGS
jgi:hypothetical protein